MKKYFIIFIILLSSVTVDVFSQPLHDNTGKAILYYNNANNTLFDYSGNPKFYFKTDYNENINVYDFEGHHIAWLEQGILHDHQGKILASQNGRIININYQFEPIKPIEKILPIKRIEELSPIKPIFINQFSTNNILNAFNNNFQTNPGYLQNDYSSRATFKPYQLPSDAIFNAIQSLNEQHNRMLALGYIYDDRTDQYYTRDQYIKIESERNAIKTVYNDFINEADKSNQPNFHFENPKKVGWYWAYFGSSVLGIYRAKVKILSNGKIRGFYFIHPELGYMYFGIDKAYIKYPYQDVEYLGSIPTKGLSSRMRGGVGKLFWHRGITKAE